MWVSQIHSVVIPIETLIKCILRFMRNTLGCEGQSFGFENLQMRKVSVLNVMSIAKMQRYKVSYLIN